MARRAVSGHYYCSCCRFCCCRTRRIGGENRSMNLLGGRYAVRRAGAGSRWHVGVALEEAAKEAVKEKTGGPSGGFWEDSEGGSKWTEGGDRGGGLRNTRNNTL